MIIKTLWLFLIVRKISVKQSKRLREYAKVRIAFLLDNKYCFCGCLATDIHHKKGRMGTLLTNTDYFLAVCRDCHSRIELSPKWAKEKGYSLERWMQ